ncbi:bifunctional 3'-5' exonuclease/ATP-dependent helicase WRN [Discoglossus pictus]
MTGQLRQLPHWMSGYDTESVNDANKKSFCKKNILEDNLPFLEFTGPLVYSYEANDCSLLSEDIRASLSVDSVLGFDIEWPTKYAKGKNGKVALVQICASEKKCYLFHVSSMTVFPKGLKRLLEDESIRKVGVGIEGDQWKLMSDCDVKLKGFIELTDLANKKLKCKEKWSLNGLIKHLFRKQLLKDNSVRCSSWDVFPLNEEQKLYAASDAYAGLIIYQKLESMDENEMMSLCLPKEKTIEPYEVKKKLSTLSQGLLNLVDQVPNRLEHFKDTQRVADVLGDISERLETLRKIMDKASNEQSNPTDCGESGDRTKEELSVNGESSDRMRNSLNQNVNGEPEKSEDTGPKVKKEQDFFMTLGISEEELLMIEQESKRDQTRNTGCHFDEDVIDEEDLSYVIESDEELEKAMLKSIENVDPGLDSAGKSLGDKKLIHLVDEEEDEGIEEEGEDDWDPSVPLPNTEQIACLKTYFGHSNFKPVQWKVISSILKERRDNLVVMATGYGKSLCYQFAPVYSSGIGIVISPLISLMEDQVLQLEMSNIPSCFLGSAQSKNVLNDVKAGYFKVIYMTPEFCTGGSSLLHDLNEKHGLTLIAIDEAHCISEWGHDFRSAYRNLGSLKRMLPTVPIVAVTATASPSIRDDIARSLGLRNPQVTCTSFDRPNLFLEVGRKTSNIFNDLQPFLIKTKGSRWEFEGATIIYCPSRKSSELVTAELTKLGIACGTYHAGMGIQARREVHHRFMRDELQCVVATVAFGMGINKADIRKVIHYGSPKEMESYYQEIGRAGRDGLPSSCHVLWAHSDMNFNRHMLSEIQSKAFREYKLKMMAKMEKYLTASTCRRKIILSHFEDKKLRKASSGIMGTDQCCDNCKTRLIHNISINDAEDNLKDFGQQAYQFLSAVEALGEKFGTAVPVLFLRGSYSQRLPDRFRCHPLFGKGKDQTDVFWRALARQLINEGFLQEASGRNKFATTCGLSHKAQNWISKARNGTSPTLLLPPNEELCPRKFSVPSLRAPSPSVMQPSPNSRSNKYTSDIQKTNLREKFSYQEASQVSKSSSSKYQSPVKPSKPPEPSVSPRELELQTALYGKLVAARQKLASEKDIPPAVLATNKVLVDMAKTRPTTVENLKRIDGVSEAKSTMLVPLVDVVKEFCNANSLQSDLFTNLVSKLESKEAVQKGPVKAALPESQQITYSLFQEQNLSLHKIAEVRGLSLVAVGMHLCQALKAGLPLNVQRVGLTPAIEKTITDVIKKPPINSDLSSFTAIRDLLPPDIDIYLIRMVIAQLEKDGCSGGNSQQVYSSKSEPLLSEEPTQTGAQENAKNKVHIENSLWIEKEPSGESSKSNIKVKKAPLESPELPEAPDVAPIKLASWNRPLLDADTEELFSESQSQDYTITPKRKLPQWFGSSQANTSSANAVKKAKTKKGLFG